MRFLLIALSTILNLHPLVAQRPRDVAFTIVDIPPIYPNCKGENTVLLKECFTNNIETVIEKNIDFDEFETLLPKGLHRVFVTFTINEKGLITKPIVRSEFLVVQERTKKALAAIPLLEPAIHKEKIKATVFATAFSIDVKKGIPNQLSY